MTNADWYWAKTGSVARQGMVGILAKHKNKLQPNGANHHTGRALGWLKRQCDNTGRLILADDDTSVADASSALAGVTKRHSSEELDSEREKHPPNENNRAHAQSPRKYHNETWDNLCMTFAIFTYTKTCYRMLHPPSRPLSLPPKEGTFFRK